MVAILDEPTGRIGKIMDHDMGFALHYQDFNEVSLQDQEVLAVNSRVQYGVSSGRSRSCRGVGNL